MQDSTQNAREISVPWHTYIWISVYHMSPSTLSYLNFNDLSKHTERVFEMLEAIKCSNAQIHLVSFSFHTTQTH